MPDCKKSVRVPLAAQSTSATYKRGLKILSRFNCYWLSLWKSKSNSFSSAKGLLRLHSRIKAPKLSCWFTLQQRKINCSSIMCNIKTQPCHQRHLLALLLKKEGEAILIENTLLLKDIWWWHGLDGTIIKSFIGNFKINFLDSCMDRKYQKKAKEVRGLSSSNNSFSPFRRSTNQHNFNLFVIYHESTTYPSNYLIVLIAGLLISGRPRRYRPQYIPSHLFSAAQVLYL